MLRTLFLLFNLINVLTLICVNGKEYETEDSIIIDVAVPRQARQIRQDNVISVSAWENSLAEGSTCITSKSEYGSCVSFKSCYPYFKKKLPDFTVWDSWVLGHYDSCSYFDAEGRQAFGVCCTNPMSVETADSVSVNNKYDISNWPPPIPTHPPNHAAPTHPPVSGSWPSNVAPLQTTTTKRPTIFTTTTKKPVYQWPPPIPTHPPQTTVAATEDFFQSDAPSYCGMKNGNQDQERIVGGQNAIPNEWPWVVALFNGGRQFCGGSLLNSIHILTAAHCIAHMTAWDVQRLTVRLGDHNIRIPNEVQHVERRIKRVVRHRGFDGRTLYNDIAILTMDAPVQYTRTVRPICLPPANSRLYHGMVGTVIGWGSLRENGPQPAVLQKVTVPVWSNAQCRSKYGPHAPGGILESMICAGQDSRDSCNGDSGGPLMVNEGHWVQIGVVSWGIGCGKGQYPGVYTRVTSFLPWIFKNMQQG